MLIGILVTTVIGIPMGVTEFQGVMSSPEPIGEIFCKFEWQNVLTLDMVVVVFTFLFIDMFDTVGTLVGVCTKAGLVNEDGTVKRIKEASWLTQLPRQQELSLEHLPQRHMLKVPLE